MISWDSRAFAKGQIPHLREELSSLSNFVQVIKVGFARYYNRRYHHRRYFWGALQKRYFRLGWDIGQLSDLYRFKSVAGRIAWGPEGYRRNSLGYHFKTRNKEHLLSTAFGLKEFTVKSEKERIRRYRRYVYEAWAISHWVSHGYANTYKLKGVG